MKRNVDHQLIGTISYRTSYMDRRSHSYGKQSQYDSSTLGSNQRLAKEMDEYST